MGNTQRKWELKYSERQMEGSTLESGWSRQSICSRKFRSCLYVATKYEKRMDEAIGIDLQSSLFGAWFWGPFQNFWHISWTNCIVYTLLGFHYRSFYPAEVDLSSLLQPSERSKFPNDFVLSCYSVCLGPLRKTISFISRTGDTC